MKKGEAIPGDIEKVITDSEKKAGVKSIEKIKDSGIMKLSVNEKYALNQYFNFESYGINEKLRYGISTTNAGESEVLYERGSKFVVRNAIDRKGKYWILLEEG